MPNDPKSLHYINPNKDNDYLKAIKLCGNILLHYDYDKLVPMFGFGGKPNMPNLKSDKVMHCFPMVNNNFSIKKKKKNNKNNTYFF